ncbi:MAG TPA: lipopolysaccharide biosynthesis protein [Terriglobales bacterium]|nr:lipopolysaccharide biosynthesis protein [Terriglobales bacterium]
MQEKGADLSPKGAADDSVAAGKDVHASAPGVAAPESQRAHLDRRLMHGIAWSGGVKYLTQFLSWASALIVARLLTPSDYGLVAMATVYLGFVTLVSEFGVGAAVVTLRDLTEEQLEQLNSFSLLLGLASFAVSLVAAYPLAWFFRAPLLPPVVMTMSVAFILTAFKAVPGSILERDLRFKEVSVIDGARAIVLAVSTVGFALAGFRYWTLVLGGILSSLVSLFLILRLCRKGFRFPRYASLRNALTFSRHILGSRLSWYIYSNSDFAVAGRMLGAVPLGNYTMAWTLANIPLQSVSNLISSVTPGFFSAVQKDRAELRRYLLNLTEGLSLVTFPLTTGLALVAHDFVLAILGTKWLPIVPPLQLLAIYASVRAITPLLSPILNVTGEARFNMRSGIVSAILFPIAFLIGSRWGTVGIAAAWMVAHPIPILFVYRRTFQKLDLTVGEYCNSLRAAFTGIVTMSAVVLSMKAVLSSYSLPPAAALALQVAVGGLAYVGSIFLLHRSRFQALYNRIKSTRSTA